MRGTKAKRIRKLAYGDLSQKGERLYVGRQHIKGIPGKPGATATLWEIKNSPTEPRFKYRALKKIARREALVEMIQSGLVGLRVVRLAMKIRERKKRSRQLRRFTERTERLKKQLGGDHA